MCDSNRFGIQSEYRLGLSDLGSSDWKAKIEAVMPERQPLNSRIFGLPVWEEHGERLSPCFVIIGVTPALKAGPFHIESVSLPNWDA